MSGPDNNWRERCEMFFSSMDKHTDQTADHQKEKRKGGKKAKIQVIDGNTVRFQQGFQPGYHPGNVTTFSKKQQPSKGWIRWLSSLDVHGTRMLPRSRSHLFCVCWTIMTIIGCVLFALGCYKFINDYIDEDYRVESTVVTKGSNASPLSLTICNKNIIRKSKITQNSRFFGLDAQNITYLQTLGVIQSSGIPSVENVMANTDLLSFLQENNLIEMSSAVLGDLNQEYTSYSEMFNESDWDSVGRSSLSVDSNTFPRAFRLTSSELREFGHDMENSILGCTKNGRQCDSSEISYLNKAEMGNCAVVHLSLDGSWFDVLTLTLDVEPDDYLDLVSPSPGILAIVQSASSLSTSWLSVSSHDFIEANPGEGLHLAVSKTHEMKRKSKNCNKDPNYNKLDCVSRCLELHTADVCGCSISLASPLDQRCRVHVQYEFLCQRFLHELYQRNQLPCKCPHPCKEEFLDLTASNFEWIRNDSESLLVSSQEAAGKLYNVTNIRDSITRIRVSWSHSTYVGLEEEDKLSLIDLLLKLGSVSAITAGISVITIIELVWLLGKAFVFLCCAVNKNRDGQKETAVHQLYPVQHIHPEFDNINVDSNWYTSDGGGGGGGGAASGGGRNQGQGHGIPENGPAAPLALADSPLNRRRINSYIIAPTSLPDADYNQIPYQQQKANYTQQSAISAQGEFIYRGRPRESGFVYGDTTNSKEKSPTIVDHDTESPNPRQQKTKKEENELFNRPWDKSGHPGVYSRVFVPNPNSSKNKEVPLFNSPYMTVGDDYNARPKTNANDKSQDLESEPGNTLNYITKSLQYSDNSKTTGSGEHSKTESQRHADSDLKLKLNDKDDDGNGNEDGNIFKISEGNINDISWIPEENTKTQGPDLSQFNTFLLTSTRKPPRTYVAQEGHGNKHQQGPPRNARVQKGFGRTSKTNATENAIHDTTPVRGNGGGQRTKLLSPNTWHNYIITTDNQPLPNPQVPYMARGYDADGREVIIRPQ